MSQAGALQHEYGRLISEAQVESLRALGHDFVETGADGAYLIDESGRRYLDCYSGAGTFNLGRRPAAVTEALRRGLSLTDQGNFPMISIEKARAAEKLARFIPGPVECSLFAVVRGEAFDSACKLARGFTGKRDLVAPFGSWFGQTGFALSLSSHPHRGDFAPLVPGARVERLATAEDVARAVTHDTAAVLLEPLQAENHCASLSREVMAALAARCRETGTVLVVDETQTGFGRTGRRFAYEHFDLLPEAVVLGEALGAGVFPICGAMFSPRLNAFLNAHPLIHLSTFGGSDLGCVVACAALEEYERLAPWENAVRQGVKIREALDGVIDARGPGIRSLAGRGLLLSLELADSQAAIGFCKSLATEGIFAKPGRVATNTVVLRPPLTLADAERDRLVAAVIVAARIDRRA
jgi:acetylornithine/succinyldiaminopimelate/putrescine aminotransferase